MERAVRADIDLPSLPVSEGFHSLAVGHSAVAAVVIARGADCSEALSVPARSRRRLYASRCPASVDEPGPTIVRRALRSESTPKTMPTGGPPTSPAAHRSPRKRRITPATKTNDPKTMAAQAGRRARRATHSRAIWSSVLSSSVTRRRRLFRLAQVDRTAPGAAAGRGGNRSRSSRPVERSTQG